MSNPEYKRWVTRFLNKVQKERMEKTMKAKLQKFFADIVDFATSRKFYVALVGAVLQAVPLFFTEQPLPEWYHIAVAFFTAIGIYSTPNKK